MYKLELLEYIKILCVQHIFVLKLADLNTSLITNISDIDSESQKKI